MNNTCSINSPVQSSNDLSINISITHIGLPLAELAASASGVCSTVKSMGIRENIYICIVSFEQVTKFSVLLFNCFLILLLNKQFLANMPVLVTLVFFVDLRVLWLGMLLTVCDVAAGLFKTKMQS
jgi:hypothetical protein